MGGKTVLEGKDHNRITQDVKQKTRQPKFGERENHEKQGVKRRKRIGTLCVRAMKTGNCKKWITLWEGWDGRISWQWVEKKGQYLCVLDGGSVWLSALWRSGEATESERREWQGLEISTLLLLPVFAEGVYKEEGLEILLLMTPPQNRHSRFQYFLMERMSIYVHAHFVQISLFKMLLLLHSSYTRSENWPCLLTSPLRVLVRDCVSDLYMFGSTKYYMHECTHN